MTIRVRRKPTITLPMSIRFVPTEAGGSWVHIAVEFPKHLLADTSVDLWAATKRGLTALFDNPIKYTRRQHDG